MMNLTATATATESDMLDCEVCAEPGCNGCTDPGVPVTVGLVLMTPLYLVALMGFALLHALVYVAVVVGLTVAVAGLWVASPVIGTAHYRRAARTSVPDLAARINRHI